MTKCSKSQTLITGVYRSGSEYFTHLLNQHPKLSASMYRVNSLRFIFGLYNPITKKQNLKKALIDTNKRLQERYKLNIDVNKIIKEVEKNNNYNYGNIYDSIMTKLYIKKTKEHWAEKNQLHWRDIPMFLGMMPNGKCIHIIRDPRSVLASFKNYTRYRYPACLSSIFNSYDSLKFSIIHNQYLSDKVKIVKFEDLIENEEKIIKDTWLFLNLNIDKKTTRNKLNFKDAYGNSWYSNSSFHKNTFEDKFDKDKAINGWRERLEISEISMVEHICGNLMNFFGYKKSIKKTDEKNFLNLFKKDIEIKNYYKNWKKYGVGIQRFPADPLDKQTWEPTNGK